MFTNKEKGGNNNICGDVIAMRRKIPGKRSGLKMNETAPSLFPSLHSFQNQPQLWCVVPQSKGWQNI